MNSPQQSLHIFSRTRTRYLALIYILIYRVTDAAFPSQRNLEPEIQEEHSFANILHICPEVYECIQPYRTSQHTSFWYADHSYRCDSITKLYSCLERNIPKRCFTKDLYVSLLREKYQLREILTNICKRRRYDGNVVDLRSLIPIGDKVSLIRNTLTGVPAYNFTGPTNFGDYTENVLGANVRFEYFTIRGIIRPATQSEMHLISITDAYGKSMIGFSVMTNPRRPDQSIFRFNIDNQIAEFPTDSIVDKWTSFEFISDGDSLRLYVNCQDVGAKSPLTKQRVMTIRSNFHIYIGASRAYSSNYYGAIEELTIYKAAQNAGEYCPNNAKSNYRLEEN